MIAAQLARLDTYPSGMARDMGGGMKVYVARPGGRAHGEDLVGTLDDASLDLIPAVDQQREFARAWLAGPGKQ